MLGLREVKTLNLHVAHSSGYSYTFGLEGECPQVKTLVCSQEAIKQKLDVCHVPTEGRSGEGVLERRGDRCLLLQDESEFT